jgi:uncharacterized protein DUF2586
MALPGSVINILDGGLGVTTPASSRPHVMGVFESGVLNTPTLISNQRQLKDNFGIHGPGNDVVGYILDIAGGPVVVTRVSPSVAATYGAANVPSSLTPVVGATGNSITFTVATSAPKNSFQIVINIITGGLLAVTTFQYSLDGGFTFSPTTQAAASVPLGTSGVTAEFASGSTGAYVAGATYANTSFAPHYASSDLTTAFVGVDASTIAFDFFVFAGEAATASAAGTLFSAIATKMTAYRTSLDRYYRAIMGAGEGIASLALTTFNALTSERIAVLYGKFRTAPSFSVVGRGLPLMPALNAAAMRATANVMSTDLAQTSGSDKVGALPGASAPTADEYRNNQGLDDKKIGTLRTAANDVGVFITNVWLKSADGSDFQYWQHGRIMDEACKTVSQQHWQLTSSSVVTKADGTGQIAEFSAQSVEKKVQRALDNRIGSGLRGIGPTAVDGTTGHVSDQRYQVDRTNNVLSTNQLIATVAIVPRGYLKTLTATISYKLSI